MERPGPLDERLRAQLFARLEDAVLITDADGVVLDCNPAAERLYGRPLAELAGRAAGDLGLVSQQVVSSSGIHDALLSGDRWDGDVAVAGPDGERTLHSQVFPIPAADGSVVFAGVTRDVTEKRRLAARLGQGERLWRSILDVAPIGLAMVSLEGRFTLVNQALCRITGHRAEALLGLTFQEITHPDDLSGDLELADALVLGKISHYTFEKRYRHAAGHPVWVQLSVSLIRHELSGAPEQFVVAVEDVTERRRAAQRLESIIATASDALIGIDAEGRITEWNAASERLFGWAREEALGLVLGDLIVPAELRAAHAAGLARLRRGEPGRILNQRVELSAVHRAGAELPVELTIWQPDGDSSEFYAFARDLTERNRAARRAQEIAEAQLAIADVELSPQKVMQEICRHAQRLTGADGACVELREGDQMVYRAASGSARASLGLRLPVAGSLSGAAVTGDAHETLICYDSETDARVHAEAAARAGARSMVLAPLRRGATIFGVVKVMAGEPNRFDLQDRSTLALLAAPFGAAMANAWTLEKTAHQAVTDSLTDLPNRAFALPELTRALRRQARHDGATAVVFLDLDRFKQVNDTFGHAAGDELLVQVADRLRAAVRTTDTPARYGGDEFLIVCENLADPKDAEILADRLLRTIPGPYELALDGRTVTAGVGASIGVAVALAGTTPDTLLHAADEAMYEAKHAGGDRHVVRYVGPSSPGRTSGRSSSATSAFGALRR